MPGRGRLLQKCRARAGQGMVEYGLTIGLIAIVCIGALMRLARALGFRFQGPIALLQSISSYRRAA